MGYVQIVYSQSFKKVNDGRIIRPHLKGVKGQNMSYFQIFQNAISFIHQIHQTYFHNLKKNTQILYQHTKTNYGGAVKRPIRPASTAPKTKH